MLLAVTMAPGFSGRSTAAEETLGMVRSMLREGDAGDAPRVHFEETLRSYYGDSASAESAPDDSPVRLLWVHGGELSDRGEDLLDAIREAWREGIEPEAYRDSTVESALARLESTRNAPAAARSELLLSDAFLRLADRLARGSGDPRAGLTWDIDPGEVDHAQLLRNLADGSSPGEELDGLRSRLPWYEPMVEALEVYREIEQNGGWPRVPTGQTVALGDTSAAVAAVRERLAASPEERVRELAEGADEPEVFDERLAGAVAAFQEHHGIAVDSVVGPGTLAAMNVSAADRVAELRLNLDRLRRLPPELGSRAILVNVAGYELVVLEGDEPVMQMDVVVGQPEWRTKIFEGELEYLVVHPYWHVPASIEAAEILPAVREDPSYLEREHLVVVNPADSYGPPVPTDDIDWDDVDPESFPYDFRQEPGPWNALGAVKFMFPNEYNIYLHDSPARELFQRHARAFSHGCIRVEKPLELARYLLEHASDMPLDELDDLLAEGERTQIDLTENVPVYIAYFTAWVDADGAVHFYPDVYDLDEPLPDAGV
jgi:L,D-transpeptidase YcbB